MITEIRIKQNYKDMGDYGVEIFEVFSQDNKSLGVKRTLGEAIMFGRGLLLGDINDGSFPFQGDPQRIVLELDPVIIRLVGGGTQYGLDNEYTAFEEGKAHFLSNKRSVT